MAEITLKGNPIHTSGELPAVGGQAPDFELAASDLSRATLATFAGKRKLLNIVPSLDTPTCAASTRRFNEEAGRIDNAVVLVISADLPFAQQRFCTTEGIEGVTVLSLMNSRKFAEDYGVLIQDGPLAGITARAVLVLDADDRIVHAQLVPEIGQEPDYDAALAALSSA